MRACEQTEGWADVQEQKAQDCPTFTAYAMIKWGIWKDLQDQSHAIGLRSTHSRTTRVEAL